MARYIIRRILWALVLFFAVTLVTYLIFFVIPVDPARLAAGQRATPEEVVRARQFLGLNEPVPVQYGRFVWRLTYHHSLGRSFSNRQDVTAQVLRAAPVTASIVFGAVLLWLAIAIPVGVVSALRPRSLIDRFGTVMTLVGISAPVVWIGLIYQYLVGFKWGLTPNSGYCNFVPSGSVCSGPAQWFYHLLLPWATFATLYSASYARMIRSSVLDVRNEDYVRTAVAKGAPPGRVLVRHVLRTALLPVVTMVGMDIGTGLGGAIFTEQIFGLHGLGFLAVQALNSFDLPTIEGIVVFATTSILFFNLLIDVGYAWLDPRIRIA